MIAWVPSRASGTPRRVWRARSFVMFSLCVLIVVTPVTLAQVIGARTRIAHSMIEVAELERARRLGQHFEARYQTIRATALPSENSRVVWTGLLQDALAGFPADEITFSIADPVVVPIEFTTGAGGVSLNEHLVQVSASLDTDAALVGLLTRLQRVGTGFMRNRSCQVKRAELNTPLRLACIYSILDPEFSGGDSL